MTEKLKCLLQVIDFSIETGRHLDIANFDRGMRNALIIIALEAIILDFGVAADAATILVTWSKYLQIGHGKIRVQQVPDGHKAVLRKNLRATFRIPETLCFQFFELLYRSTGNPALV